MDPELFSLISHRMGRVCWAQAKPPLWEQHDIVAWVKTFVKYRVCLPVAPPTHVPESSVT